MPRAAALRREPQLLRPAVHRPDAETAGRPHRGPLARDRHRAAHRRPHAPSTVGTVTEIYDYFRILISRLGQMHCPELREPPDRHAIGRSDHRQAVLDQPSRHQALPDGPGRAGHRRPVRGPVANAPRGRLRAGADRRPDAPAGRNAKLRPTPQAPSGGGGRPRDQFVPTLGRARIADSVENALALGQGRAARGRRGRRVRPRATVAGERPQPASGVPRLRSGELRAALAAPFFVQQLDRLVPGLRGLGHRVGREPGRPFARCTKLTLAEGAVLAWPAVADEQGESSLFQRDARSPLRPHRPAARRAASTSSPPVNAAKCSTARASEWIEVEALGAEALGAGGKEVQMNSRPRA